MSTGLVWQRIRGVGRRVAYVRPPEPWRCLVCDGVSETGQVLEPNGIYCDHCRAVRPGVAVHAKGEPA